jgi:hypothetical protein
MRLVILILVGIGVAWFARYVAVEKAHDFRVFYNVAADLREGNTDLYGPHGAMSWPMICRYPPWFALAMIPWSLAPFEASAFLWTVLKFLALWLVVRMILRMLRRARNPNKSRSGLGGYWAIPILTATPALVEEFESGNVHFFIFAAMVGALYHLPRKKMRVAWCFALGIGVKLIPFFFLPYLAVRRTSRWVAITLLLLLLLFILPAAFLGWLRNLELFWEWLKSSAFGYLSGGEPVFPLDYSLHGVLTRYLSRVDYSILPDANYPNINLVSLSPHLLTPISMVVSWGAYAILLWLAWRLREGVRDSEECNQISNLEYAILFCSMLLLLPAVQKIYFVVVLFPAIVVAYELSARDLPHQTRKSVRFFLAGSLILFSVPPLIPGAELQRLIDAYSSPYFGTLFLLGCLASLLRYRYRQHFG